MPAPLSITSTTTSRLPARARISICPSVLPSGMACAALSKRLTKTCSSRV